MLKRAYRVVASSRLRDKPFVSHDATDEIRWYRDRYYQNRCPTAHITEVTALDMIPRWDNSTKHIPKRIERS